MVNLYYVYRDCLLKYTCSSGSNTYAAVRLSRPRLDYLHIYCRNKLYKNGKGDVEFAIYYGTCGSNNVATEMYVALTTTVIPCRMALVV
jgi:hypothetical protein